MVVADGCSIGQLPDAANAKPLVRSYSAAASCLAASSRWCFVLLGIGAPHGSFFPMVPCGGPATMRRCICIFATAPRQFCRSASASNKPHSAEKSTPVWLAVWRIWAGFANSQLLRATFHSTYSYKCTPTLLPPCNRCSDIANLSAHLHRLPTPPPYLRQMRLLPGRGAGVRCWMRLLPAKGAGVGWQMMLLVVRGTVPVIHRAHESLF